MNSWLLVERGYHLLMVSTCLVCMATDTQQLSFPSVALDTKMAVRWPPMSDPWRTSLWHSWLYSKGQWATKTFPAYPHSGWKGYRWQGKVSVNETNMVIRGLSKKYPTIFSPTVINGERVGKQCSGRRDFHAHAWFFAASQHSWMCLLLLDSEVV
jgi:hypothetical protein